ncbi:MAG: UbiX family flavin prenyltransferase [Candidatus Hydrogenedentota bacterium]|nr:MAG: UbiX family flavin prenyltransferase [Candidatus Hydrogenedentota bacterium]
MTSSSPPIVVGITGASGAIYAEALLSELVALNRRIELVVSRLGRRLLSEELGKRPEDFTGPLVRLHPVNDLGASIATGTKETAGMVIVPCTTGTAGRIAAGTSDNLLCRAADVTLKERRPLLLVIRETPLNLVHLRALTTLAEAGAVILPASPGFYHNPTSIEDLVHFVTDRVLRHLGLSPRVPIRYNPGAENPSAQSAGEDS